uniref:Xin actin-binding repeat-containing protein 2 n=1 Tax=Cacopsylla melanoneura TaxID=428564 RepID=A0A8D8XUA8_9HEMI
MAGIAKNGSNKVVSNSSESVSDLSFSTDTTSLQELIESELAMRDPSNTINKSSPVANNVCTDNVNNISVPNNKHLAHDSSPSSKFDQIFRETFKEDSDIEDTYTNTPEILSPQLTSSTELLDMSYSMKFEKLTQQETYNKQIIDPLAHQINREDVESESLDNCREIIRLKSSIKESNLSNGDLMNHTNGTNDYEEINYDPQVKIKNAYNEKFLNEEPDIVEYEEISKFNVNQTNMFIENEIYHNNREKCHVDSNHTNGHAVPEHTDVVDKASPVVNGHLDYENVKIDHNEEKTKDPFESISESNQLVAPMTVTSATNYNVKLPTPSVEDYNEEKDSVIYENIENSVRPEEQSTTETEDQGEEQGVDFDEFDPTETITATVPTKPVLPSFPTPKPVEESPSKPSVESPQSPQIIGVSSKSKFVEPSDQLLFESWTTPEVPEEDPETSRIQIIEKSESSQDQDDHSSSQEVLSESYETSEKKTAKKKKNGVLEETSVTTTKTKKSKKSKKSDEKENHISVKSSFSKFDELSKKALASSMTDVPRTLQNGGGSTADISGGAGSPPPALCKSCGKNVFVMEQIKAEKQTWHKNCFRCKECNKQLTLDIYSSHEGILYCKPHFRELFKPKAVVESPDPEPIRRRKPEMIIRENQPLELPPDVVRASDKPDLGLEELSSLNVKSRYQVFEKSGEDKSGSENGALPPNVKRSPSILSKVAKFQAKGGLSAGVSDENLNGVHYEESDSSESSEAEQDDDVSREKIIKNRKKRERPLSFSKMSDVKKTWENGPMTKEERLEERKLEKQNLRSRLFMGKQGKMKEMYEQAVADSEKGIKREIDIQTGEKARNVREKFERGELGEDGEGGEGRNKSAIEEDLGVFEAGISKKSRSLFLELDANAAKTVTSTPPPHSASPRSPRFDESRRPSKEVSRQVSSEDIVRSSDRVEDVQVETSDISSKFKFFETYKPAEIRSRTFRMTPPREDQVKGESPDREVFRDPSIVRADEPQEDDSQVVVKSATASKMLSMFRQMEEAASKEVVPDGPKPLKRFTPPPDYKGHTGDTASEEEESSEEEEEEEESEPEPQGGDMARASYKVEDEFLKQAANAARSKALAAKFEHWEPEKQSANNAVTMLDSEQASLDSTKSLRARFESLNSADAQADKPKPRVNRFV